MEHEVAVVEEVVKSAIISRKVMIGLGIIAAVGVTAIVVKKLSKKFAKKQNEVELLTTGDTESNPEGTN